MHVVIFIAASESCDFACHCLSAWVCFEMKMMQMLKMIEEFGWLQVWKMEEQTSRIFMMVAAEESTITTEIMVISVVVDNVYFSKCKQYTIASLGIGKGGCCKGSFGKHCNVLDGEESNWRSQQRANTQTWLQWIANNLQWATHWSECNQPIIIPLSALTWMAIMACLNADENKR